MRQGIAVVAMLRSGHHAVADWIASHFDEVTFRHCAYDAHYDTHVLADEPAFPIMNIEDRTVADARLQIRLDMSVQRIEWTVALVLRDPYNLFVSRRAAGKRNHDATGEPWLSPTGHSDWMDFGLWNSHASTIIEDFTVVPVLFNEWFRREEYRHDTRRRLRLPDSDRAADVWQRVSSYGGGSSFDGTAYDERASEMKVLERYRDNAWAVPGKTAELAELLFGRFPDSANYGGPDVPRK